VSYLAISPDALLDDRILQTMPPAQFIEEMNKALRSGPNRESCHGLCDVQPGPVSFLDQLTVAEASKAITYLKALKDGESSD
jgi:hypothetical protein